MNKRIFLTLLLIFISIFLFADKLVIGVSFAIPPYVIKDNNAGIELEILSESFSAVGHTIEIKYLPLARTFVELSNGKVDGIINIKEGMLDDVFYSDDVITFNNCAISLTKRDFPNFEGFSFLRDKKIIAFQRASEILGKEFGSAVKNNEFYEEKAAQMVQVNRLFLEREVDFIILEKWIFRYYRKEASKILGNTVEAPITYHSIFEPTIYKFAFKQEKIMKDFNRGLKTIKDNGTYDQIFKKYEDMMLLK